MTPFKKAGKILCITFSALLLHASLMLSAQTQDNYIKSMNSLLPGTPEAVGLMRYIDFPVNLFNGKPNVTIPICEVKGKSLSLPISISYNASGGIKINDMAGNVGLGWILFSGEITREVRGEPDEGGCCGAVGLMQNPLHPIAAYFNDPIPSNVTHNMQNAAKGSLDLEPDMFYFSIGGTNGKFMYDEETSSFVCTQLEPYKITFDLPNSSWSIIGPDGNIYLFEKKVTTASQPSCNSNYPVAAANPITTSWKLTKMYNADKTDSVTIQYDYNTYYYYSEGSSTLYQLNNLAQGAPSRPGMECFNKNNIDGWDKILSICSTRDTVSFQYATDVRQDLGQQQKALAYIIYSNGQPLAKKIFKMDYDYYIRNTVVGAYPTPQTNAENFKSLRLTQITNYGNAETNANPLKWIFTYNPYPLPARLSYSQDFWGYYNGNTNGNTLAPKDVFVATTGDYVTFIDGADRFADTNRIQAGVLQKIQFPTGGTTTFEYEVNTTATPTDMAKAASSIPILNFIKQGTLPPLDPYDNESKNFRVYVPQNPEAGMEDGVIATIAIDPVTPPNPGNNSVLGYPTFSLNKMFEADGSPVGTNGGLPFHQNFWLNAVTTVFLPNGIYEMDVHINGFTGNTFPSGDGSMGDQGVSFTIAYDIPDTASVTNYILGGLRIKSVTSTDQYSNVTSKKEYSYNDPISGASYGVFTGSTIHENTDYWNKEQTGGPSGGGNMGTCSLYLYLARHGNCIMPGSSLGSVVVYPTVIENTVSGNKRYKTEYHYNYTPASYSGGYPYSPPLSHESGDGKLLSSTAFQTINSSTYWPAKTLKNQYNFNPATQASNGVTAFKKYISGMRVAFAGYTDNITCGFDYAYSNLYRTEINRSDLTSDSIITYDLNNQLNGTNDWHDYVYGDYNQQPIVVRTGNSDGGINKQENYYPIDFPITATIPGTLFAGQLQVANRVNQLLGAKSYKDNQLLSQKQFYGHFINNDPKMLIDSMQDAVLNNPLETEVKILSYDNSANPLLIELKGNRYRRYIWNSGNSLPLATCVSANQNDFFYFTSFENNSDNGTSGAAFSGSKAYQLITGVSLGFTSPTVLSNEDVFVWATSGIPILNNSPMVSVGKTKGAWTLYKSHISSGSSLTFSGTALMDQLVISPTGSQFQGNIYDANDRIIAVFNDQLLTSFFEYDNFGRLNLIRDEQGNILKGINYQYQAAQ